jgi:Rrf2 family iron-sulfur cluster assembly transcriptional regulator
VLLAIWKQAGDVMRRHLDGYTLASIATIAKGEAPWPATTG